MNRDIKTSSMIINPHIMAWLAWPDGHNASHYSQAAFRLHVTCGGNEKNNTHYLTLI